MTTAVQRTLSLSTRKADTEDPRARDGSAPDERPYESPRRPSSFHWTEDRGGAIAWECKQLAAQIEKRGEGCYHLTISGASAGAFPTVWDAAIRAERGDS